MRPPIPPLTPFKQPAARPASNRLAGQPERVTADKPARKRSLNEAAHKLPR